MKKLALFVKRYNSPKKVMELEKLANFWNELTFLVKPSPSNAMLWCFFSC